MPKAAKPKRPERYHHGNLREALIAAAEGILAREGPDALTLRAAARAAGVSHAAPAHHFGDLKGLLTELAAVGFERLAARVRGARRDGANVRSHMGRAYVAFARENPALFQLMFRSHALDQTSPRLRDASSGAFASFAGAIAPGQSVPSDVEPGDIARAATVARAWSLVHGFAVLSVDGRLKPLLQLAGGKSEDDLLDAMLFGAPSTRPRTKSTTSS
jgi:AcrR family transcriptional regulator